MNTEEIRAELQRLREDILSGRIPSITWQDDVAFRIQEIIDKLLSSGDQ
jgi:hypothetical protein